jgi:hypothetical protein
MFYWGYSMSLFHPLWPDAISSEASVRGAKLLLKATKQNTTNREKDYTQAATAHYKN